ncbi:MAG: T9SS type A sorting domain-containing protein [Bacteroidota bacterium]
MKKITLFLLSTFILAVCHSQQTFSFETSGGFTLGDINGQNGWVSTGDGNGGFVTGQVVSNEQASDGNNSLKTIVETAFPPQANPVVGGFYDFTAPVDYTTAIISFDAYITQQDASSSRFRFGVVGQDAMGDSFFTYVIDFSPAGDIQVANAAGNLINIGTWSINTWYNLRAEVNNSDITFFIDDTQAGTSVLLNDFDFTAFRFVHDNNAGDGFIDNIRINDEELSVSAFSENELTYHYSTIDKIFSINSTIAQLNHVEIFDVLGRKSTEKKLSGNSDRIRLSQLNNGIYIATISSENGVQSFKFVKN